jgi:hypothetical protein
VNQFPKYEDIITKDLDIIAAAMTYEFCNSIHPDIRFESICGMIIEDIKKKLPDYIQPGEPIWGDDEETIIGYAL